LVRHIREKGRPVVLAVNKADREEDREAFLGDFHTLGCEWSVAFSASHGIGLDDLLDLLVAHTPEKTSVVEDSKKPFKIAVLGKPNVGKSSILNALLGRHQLGVDDTPGTTHDAIPVVLEAGERDLVMVDTAGIRAHKQVDSRVERLSIDQALYELQTCQVVLLVLDGEKGIAHQDVSLSKVLREAFRPVVVVVNKWDIHPKGAERAWAEKHVHQQLRHLDYAPVLFVSAKNKMGIEKIVPAARALYEESCRHIPTAQFNKALQEAVNRQAPPFARATASSPFRLSKAGHPPAFEVYANHRNVPSSPTCGTWRSRCERPSTCVTLPCSWCSRPRRSRPATNADIPGSPGEGEGHGEHPGQDPATGRTFMSATAYYVFMLVWCYLLGSIPMGYVLLKAFKNVDIRTLGSGNIGMTNVWRVAGAPWGIATLALDIAKGALAIYVAKLYYEPEIDILVGAVGVCWSATFSRSICGSRAAREWAPASGCSIPSCPWRAPSRRALSSSWRS
jgi:ribosome-associated GTPase EngA